MGLLGLFQRKRQNADAIQSAMAEPIVVGAGNDVQNADISENRDVQDEKPTEKLTKTITEEEFKNKFIMETPAERAQLVKNELPIYDIYRRLQDDWEQRGYGDAIAFPETSYRDSQKSVIVDKLRLAIKEALRKYEDKIVELDNLIENAEKNGLIETLNEYRHAKQVLSGHFDELSLLDKDAQEIGEKTTVILNSYDMGFRRGQASITNNRVSKIMNW